MQYPVIAQPQYAFAPTMPMMAEGGLVPAARAVQSKGRNGDSMLVHMTPGEVGGLQALAMQHGGSLSINPQTGLPEANFLKNLLPTLLGVGLSFIPGVGPLAAAGIVGGAETLRTGDLGKGLMAGLGAYGGANLAGGFQAAGASAASSAPGVVAPNAAPITAATDLAGKGAYAAGPVTAGAPTAVGQVGTSVLPSGAAVPSTMLRSGDISMIGAGTPAATAPTFASNVAQAGQGVQNVFTGQEGAFKSFIGTPATKTAEATGLGGAMGAAKTVGSLAAPSLFAMPEPPEMPKEEKSDYEGPYKPSERRVSYPGEEERRRTSEFMYFSPSNPVPFAEGGETAATPDVAVSPNEARVYQDIMNVQRLAGLPALDPNRFAVMPGRSYEDLVYNPIEGGPSSGGVGPEKNYGFKPLSESPAGGAAGGMQFFRPVQSSRNPIGRVLDRVKGKNQDVEPFTPKGRVDMADFYYDPELGGYVEKPKSSGLGKGSNYATGGRVSVPQLEDGGFVLTKKAVDGLGKGDNKRGQKAASRGLGAIPIKGPGTGTSDSIKTSIEGKRPALVSNGEAYVPKKQVAKRGGAKAFYALMDKAEKQAKKAKRA